jgi:hypothetical protein
MPDSTKTQPAGEAQQARQELAGDNEQKSACMTAWGDTGPFADQTEWKSLPVEELYLTSVGEVRAQEARENFCR